MVEIAFHERLLSPSVRYSRVGDTCISVRFLCWHSVSHLELCHWSHLIHVAIALVSACWELLAQFLCTLLVSLSTK